MALLDDVRTLASNPTLGRLEPEALQLIAFSGETRILRSGDVLFRSGDVSDSGYVMLSGAMALRDEAGRHTLVGPPALLGDLALIAETLRPCTALAEEPSRVLKISRELFHRVLNEFPGSAARLREVLDARLATLRADLQKLHHDLS